MEETEDPDVQPFIDAYRSGAFPDTPSHFEAFRAGWLGGRDWARARADVERAGEHLTKHPGAQMR